MTSTTLPCFCHLLLSVNAASAGLRHSETSYPVSEDLHTITLYYNFFSMK